MIELLLYSEHTDTDNGEDAMSNYDGPEGMGVTLTTHTPPHDYEGVIVRSDAVAVHLSVLVTAAGHRKVYILPWSTISYIRER